jgi:hypothetical protein
MASLPSTSRAGPRNERLPDREIVGTVGFRFARFRADASHELLVKDHCLVAAFQEIAVVLRCQPLTARRLEKT